MQARALLPDSSSLSCDSVTWESDRVIVTVSGVITCAACPKCGHSSERIHSRYVRRLADLPWQGLRVEMRWRCRRLFCTEPCCQQRIFTERLPELAAPYARKTSRLTIIMRAIAFACGGEEGARLADRLGVSTSSDTLIREIRRTPAEACPPVRVVGVDDWALRRGRRYGTILVDLERRQPIDLLPERSSASVAAWLQLHPEVEVVSRDRGDCYIKGADVGAPQATQVTDRWHLLHNLQEALMQLVDRHRKSLKDVTKSMRQSPGEPAPEEPHRPALSNDRRKPSRRVSSGDSGD